MNMLTLNGATLTESEGDLDTVDDNTNGQQQIKTTKYNVTSTSCFPWNKLSRTFLGVNEKSSITRNITFWGYTDITDDFHMHLYREKIQEFCDGEEMVMKELQTCCRLNCINRVKIMVEIINDQWMNNLQDETYEDEQFESPLMLSISSQSLETARYLIHKGRTPLITKRCKRSHHKGASALHFAIMNGAQKIIKEMLDLFDNHDEQKEFVNSYSDGSIFKSRNMSGSTPLLALQCGYLDIYFQLIDNGVDMDYRDPGNGHTAIHTIVEYGQNDPKFAKELLYQFFHHQSAVSWFCRKFKMNPSEYMLQDEYDSKNYLLKIENKDGYTPLTYAAKLGVYPILMELLQCEGVYKQTQWRLGSTCYATYDMAEIDPVVASIVRPGKPNVLEHLLYNYDDDIPVLSVQPIKELILKKWRSAFPAFVFWMVLHFILMLWGSYLTIRTNNYITSHNISNTSNQSLQENIISAEVDAYQIIDKISQRIWAQGLCILIVAAFYGMLFVKDIYNRTQLLLKGRLLQDVHVKHYKVPTNIVFHWDEYKIVYVVFTATTLAWAGMLVTSSTTTIQYTQNGNMFVNCFIVSLMTGWFFLLYFARCFKATSYFTVMMKRIVMTDLVRFTIVMLIFLIGFGIGIQITFTPLMDKIPSEVSSIGKCLETLFLIMIGMKDIDFISAAPKKYQIHVRLMIYTFLIISSILMLNMLIAAMSTTYMSATNNRKYILWKLRMQAVTDMERNAFLWMVKKVFVERYMHYDGDRDTWLLPVKEIVVKDNTERVINNN